MYAVALLLFSPGYLPGALVLGFRLRHQRLHGAKLVLLVEKAHFSHHQLQLLASVWDVLEDVKSIQRESQFAKSDTFPFWHAGHAKTFTKILLWSLSYEKVLYLDCDTLPRMDPGAQVTDLLALDILPHSVAAAPDSANPDTFNSGVLLLRPNREVFDELQNSVGSSYDGGDQGLLNAVFNPHPDWLADIAQWTFSQPNVLPQRPPTSRWTPIPYLYNTTLMGSSGTSSSYALDFYSFAANEHYGEQARCVHFIGPQKPWEGGQSRYASEWWAAWWDFSKGVSPEALLNPPGQISIKKLQVPTIEDPHPEPVIATLLLEGWTEHLEYQPREEAPEPFFKPQEAPLTPSDLCDPLKYIDVFGPAQSDSTWDATREEPPREAPNVPTFAEEIQMFRSLWDDQREPEELAVGEVLEGEPPAECSESLKINEEEFESAEATEIALSGHTAERSFEPVLPGVGQSSPDQPVKDDLGIFHTQVAERVFDDRSNYTPQHSLLLREQKEAEEIVPEEPKSTDSEVVEVEDEVKKESEEMEKDKALEIDAEDDSATRKRGVGLAPLFPWELRPALEVERTFDY